MQRLPMKLNRACWINFVTLVLAVTASVHLPASGLEQQILSAIAIGEDISELVPQVEKEPLTEPPSSMSPVPGVPEATAEELQAARAGLRDPPAKDRGRISGLASTFWKLERPAIKSHLRGCPLAANPRRIY
jgi:hypothetical protein